jgi:hypothetical protein
MNTYKAPWSTLLTVITTIVSVVLLGIMVIGISIQMEGYQFQWYIIMIGLPAAILIITVFFMIRKFELRGSSLLIHRLGWKKSIDLGSLKSAEFDPAAAKNSIRLFGNGGLFAFSGIYRNKKLGNYRIYATDFKKCVVLKTDQRTFVITPENPEKFVEEISILINK